MIKVYIETYGCTMNRGDTEIMKHSLSSQCTENIEEADIVIVNSCGVKGQTEKKVVRRIKELCDTKKVVVAGCLPLINRESIDDRVRGILDPQSVDRVNEVVEKVAEDEKIEIFSENKDKSFFKKRREGITAIIPISEGCIGGCAYCGTKHARGPLLSFDFDNLVEEVKDAVRAGYKQILITSQDTGCYGFDTDRRLPELLEKIAAVDGKFKVRVGMMNPNNALKILDDLVKVYRSEKIYNFLHLPVQSGDNSVLEKMNRQYTVEDFERVVKKFRREIDNLYLCTDIIVGFPGETNEKFENTVDLIHRTNPDKINVTRFSTRPNTTAEKMEQVYGWVKKERSRRLHDLRMEISHKINLQYVGNKYEVLVVRKGKKHMVGRMENYKPVIVKGNVGEFKKVKITKAARTYLMAV